EKAGTTDSQEYQDAVMVYYREHLCRLQPWPEDLNKTFAEIGMDEYMTMWGPSEFYSTGNLKNFDGTAQLKQIKIPVLFISGKYDEASPEATKFYQDLVPGSELVILQNSSHMAMLEETEAYIQSVRDFLHKVEKN